MVSLLVEGKVFDKKEIENGYGREDVIKNVKEIVFVRKINWFYE